MWAVQSFCSFTLHHYVLSRFIRLLIVKYFSFFCVTLCTWYQKASMFWWQLIFWELVTARKRHWDQWSNLWEHRGHISENLLTNWKVGINLPISYKQNSDTSLLFTIRLLYWASVSYLWCIVWRLYTSYMQMIRNYQFIPDLMLYAHSKDCDCNFTHYCGYLCIYKG